MECIEEYRYDSEMGEQEYNRCKRLGEITKNSFIFTDREIINILYSLDNSIGFLSGYETEISLTVSSLIRIRNQFLELARLKNIIESKEGD
jgi:hypothetical protein